MSNGYELETVRSDVVMVSVRAARFSIVASGFLSECSTSLRFWLILASATVRHSVEGLRVAGWPTMVPSGTVDI